MLRLHYSIYSCGFLCARAIRLKPTTREQTGQRNATTSSKFYRAAPQKHLRYWQKSRKNAYHILVVDTNYTKAAPVKLRLFNVDAISTIQLGTYSIVQRACSNTVLYFNSLVTHTHLHLLPEALFKYISRNFLITNVQNVGDYYYLIELLMISLLSLHKLKKKNAR